MTLNANVKRKVFGRHNRALSQTGDAERSLNAAPLCRREDINSKTFSHWRKQTQHPGGPGMVTAPVRVRHNIPSGDAACQVLKWRDHFTPVFPV